jgi:hypothetical protein
LGSQGLNGGNGTPGPDGAAYGAGLFDGAAADTLSNATIANNHILNPNALPSSSGVEEGAGAYFASMAAGHAATLFSDTIAGNHVAGTNPNDDPLGAGVYNSNMILALANTLMATNTDGAVPGAADFFGSVASSDHDLIGVYASAYASGFSITTNALKGQTWLRVSCRRRSRQSGLAAPRTRQRWRDCGRSCARKTR